jgi:predicted metal-dependent phosphoesterase TrpH/anti-sigma regulatory factor (Ser/Thr protein kinase)
MKELKADLHIHTCLSPCGEAEMVPSAIVRRARAAGLDMIGICDHNSAENAAAVARAGERASISVIPGIEITSREEVHVVGLFPGEQEAQRAQAVVDRSLAGENDEAAFGPQTIVDEWDRPTGRSTKLLIGATRLALEEVVAVVHDCGGLAVAAHIDRERFGLVGQLGFIPEGLKLDAVEVSPGASRGAWNDFPVITSSDAHCLKDIGRGSTWFFAEDASLAEIGRALREEGGRRAVINMEDLSLHILDIVENSIAASASRVRIVIEEDTRTDRLSLEIRDNGRGMDAEARKKALDPFFTTRTTRRVGLGLSLLAQAARESGGRLELDSQPGRGTTVRAVFQLSHPDRKPLGDVAETLRTILCGQPELDLEFQYKKDSKLIAALGGDPPDHEESENG